MRIIQNIFLFLCLTTAVVARAAPLPSDAPPDFDREVAAIFASRCFDCHNTAERKGKLDLTHRESAMAGGKDGVVIVPGKLDESLLWKHVSENEMPPKHPLPDAEKRVLQRWVASGAKWGSDPIDPFRFTTSRRAGYDWWSLQPVKPQPIPPVKNARWVRNPIDAFVLAELERSALAPSPEADKRTLIRRLTFDLIGLPPTPEQVQAFEKDDSPDAYEKLVDRLLASPDYRARWARHWLDLVRFGESHGFERDQIRPNAWRYRDWVVDALNADMPYPRFVQMQLARDIIEPGSAAGIIATGCLVAGAYDDVGNTQQSAIMRAVVVQDQLEDIVGAMSQTFLGLTANCARCHNHKFDPIAQKEYYQLASAMSGVRFAERDLPAAEIQPAAKAYAAVLDRRLAALQAQVSQIETPARRQVAGNRTVAKVDPPKPIAEWKFSDNLRDTIGGLHAEMHGEIGIGTGALQLSGNGYAITAPLTTDLKEKTLEAWVSLRDLRQRGGGVIGVQSLDGGVFDTIVFGERDPGRWMAGSEFYKRYKSFDGPAESAESTQFVQIAVAYHADGRIVAYRNGQPYGQPYHAVKLETFPAGKSMVVFGIRHTPKAAGKYLSGAIQKARLYDRALSDVEIAASAGVTPGVDESAVTALLSESDRALREQLRYEMQAIRRQQSRAAVSKTFTCVPGPPAIGHLLIRGNSAREGEIVSPAGIASIVGPEADFGLKPDAPDRDRRRKVAEWITDSRNPLFPRVIVNRLWLYHFGNGIVETPSDLGFNGAAPSHPALLDWLAGEMPKDGWSLKRMHRLMVTSAAYRQSSLQRPDAMKVDTSNRLLWRMNPRRIEAEALRDAVLFVSGELNPQLGGPGFEDFYTFTRNSTFYEFRDYVGATFNRRSLYRTWIRSGRSPLLDVFDCPDPSTKTPRRAVTTTPLQALALMNDSFILRMSDSLAGRARHEAGEDIPGQVKRVYELTLARPPTDEEQKEASAFVSKDGLPALCRVIFNCSEFVSAD